MTESLGKHRNPNIDWMRVCAMLMVVLLHALGKSGLLEVSMYESRSINAFLVWTLEAFAIVAVNVYVLVSGYVLTGAKFKTGRFLSLIFEVLFYSVGGYFILCATGVVDRSSTDTYTLLNCVFPIHMDTFWFMTSYVVMYMLLPILNAAIAHMAKGAHLAVIVMLLIYECGFKSFLPFVMGIEDHGYSYIWFIVLFLISAYVKKYGLRFVNTSGKGALLYFCCVFLIVCEQFVLQMFMGKYGRFELLQSVSYDYNHVLVLAASVGFFVWFLLAGECHGVLAKIGTIVAPTTLGVYLCHEHVLIRYEWQKWLKLDTLMEAPVWRLLLSVLAAVLAVFAAGFLIDCLRISIFNLLGKAVGKTAVNKKINKLDDIVNGSENT